MPPRVNLKGANMLTRHRLERINDCLRELDALNMALMRLGKPTDNKAGRVSVDVRGTNGHGVEGTTTIALDAALIRPLLDQMRADKASALKELGYDPDLQ